jgi:hypothetical protein|tara:strand:- start:781 stop:915 length:135 start_codon:yes stop_codon:yes gene_type:complete
MYSFTALFWDLFLGLCAGVLLLLTCTGAGVWATILYDRFRTYRQ